MSLFSVYIDKVYFPEEERPKGLGVEHQMKWKVRATCRSEAAAKVWDREGKKIVPKLRPIVGIVSLHVSGEGAVSSKSKNRNFAGRLHPIVVWRRQ